MRGLLLALIVTLASSGFAAEVKQVELKTITPLHKIEVGIYNHALTKSTLWVGHNRIDEPKDNPKARVEAYDLDGNFIAKAYLTHTPDKFYPYDENRVIIIGKATVPGWGAKENEDDEEGEGHEHQQRFTAEEMAKMSDEELLANGIAHIESAYTIAELQGNQIKLSTTHFPEIVMGDNMAEYSSIKPPQYLYFNDIGSQLIFRWDPVNKKGKGLKTPVVGPANMRVVGDYLYVVERRKIQHGDENLVRINIKEETAERVFEQNNRQFLTEMLPLQNNKVLAVSETGADQVLFVDVATNKVTDKIWAPGEPRGLTSYGHCLVGVSLALRQVYFWDLDKPGKPLVDQWDVSRLGTFEHPIKIDMHEASGRLFLRGAGDTCASCEVSRSSEIYAQDLTGETAKLCH